MNHASISRKLGLKHPLVVAPMAGGPSTPDLVAQSSLAGALGSIGAAYMSPPEIEAFAAEVRRQTSQSFAINLFIPHPVPQMKTQQIDQAIQATQAYRNELGLQTPALKPPFEENFDQQFEAVLRLKPAVLSFVFGLLQPAHLAEARKQDIYMIGTATSLQEALALQESGVDAITLQGFEAGGHRGIFDPQAKDPEIPMLDLLKSCVAKCHIPLIAAGGILNREDIQVVLSAGAQAVQMGTAFLTCQEAGTSAPYRQMLLQSANRKTQTTRVFSGRLARGIENRFLHEMERRPDAILPFPAQNQFTRDLRQASAKSGLPDFMSLWSGSKAGPLWTGSTSQLIEELFRP